MGMELFPHNQQAYESAAAMLSETGKAAVVHPTGTGKSFIAFKLCADHRNKTVCWLSPSEYIFKTQMENWLAAGGERMENITFFTYAKLMLLSGDEISEIRPDFIILDEFHRCGAEMWGKGVAALLAAFPDAPVLGLSATSVRYLDNQRDMADELFEGNIASEMTLGEAIARGILAAPKYITTIYSYQKELKRYEKRVSRLKNSAARSQAERYLEALRRSLDKADGLDEIFARHMTDRTGKYLVFCANVQHMEELLSCCGEWFRKVDSKPHIYRAYSDNPGTSAAFAAFKEDASEHLKLLFCIDMLNEGIHVDSLSGVILFRPTVSPIIYKQQIGRALTASGSREPVIFDVVNNFENLYSIGAIQAEMEQAALYFQAADRGRPLVRDRFQIIDEVRESRQLFDALNETLTAPWEAMYAKAKEYFQIYSNLNVPKRFKTEDGCSLGAWITTQRRVRTGRQYGTLTPERIAKLDAIGMVWEDQYTASWKRYYAALSQYRQKHGNLDIPADFVTEDGLRLGSFVSNLRAAQASGARCVYLTEDRLQQLNGLGMIWNKLDFLWERNYAACLEFYREHGHLDIPVKYVSPNGLKTGIWLRQVRRSRTGRKGRLTQEQIKNLDAIGMIWEDSYTRQWEYGYQQALKWYQRHGDLEVPAAYVDEDGFSLGKWISRHRDSDPRTGRRAIRLTPERKAKLDALGMRWEKDDPWEMRYQLAKAYYREHGDLNVPGSYVANGVWLNKWLNEQKQIYRGRRPGKMLTARQMSKLEKIGMVWESQSTHIWNERYEEARRFFFEHGNLDIPNGYVGQSGKRLDLWVERQRQKIRRGTLTRQEEEKFAAIGIQ